MELKGLDENSTSNFENPQKQEKTKKPRNLKKWAGLIIFVLVVVGANIYNKVSEQNAAKKAEEEQLAEDELELIMSDPHLQRDYYLNTVYSDLTTQAVAEMIGHVILTGCKDSYESLRKYFDAESMKYLYADLGGFSCTGWEQVPCSKQEVGVKFEDYKVVKNAKEQYLIHINLDNDLHPVSFSISDYFTGKDRLENTDGEVSGEMEKKDHSNIINSDEITTEEETTTEETTTAKKSLFKK